MAAAINVPLDYTFVKEASFKEVNRTILHDKCNFTNNYQNLSFCCFLVQIRANVFLKLSEIDKFK